jgi:hypothetical protein
MTERYDLPLGYRIDRDEEGGYSLSCNNRFIFWDVRLAYVFVIFGRIMDKDIET